MAQIFNPNKSGKNRKHKSLAKQLPDFIAKVESYDPEGKGIIRAESGRIAFVTGALVGEVVKVRPITYNEKIIKGETLQVIEPSPKRVTPHCTHFDVCGGCQLQYMQPEHQTEAKQLALNTLFQKQLGLTDIPWQQPIVGPDWHYRRTARLSIWFDSDKSFRLGFRQKKSKQIIDVEQCPILVQSLTDLLPSLKTLIQSLTNRRAITHVQLYALDNGNTIIFRVIESIKNEDKERLSEFAKQNKFNIILQHNEHEFEQISALKGTSGTELEYQMQNCRFQFSPEDFIQVNSEVNQQMVAQALQWLAPTKDDVVLDLFSGVGNFTLPLALKAKQVFAVEGVNNMVLRLQKNAELNQIDNISAHQADLSKLVLKYKPKWLKPIDKLLLDPARDGAFDVVQKIPLLAPKKILYVSCNPSTMVRDIKELQQSGYKLSKLGLLNMFPHTAHIEAMALLEKE
jgi:23S rRNA (uracil1939-C5)-methyltransferase